MDLLTDDFDVIACDSPGFGRSPALPAGVAPTIPAYTDAFERFFASMGLVESPPHVAGNSMGGAIALELVRRGVVRSATAISPAGFWSPAELRYCQLLLGVLARTPRPLQPVISALARTRAGRGVLFGQIFAWPGRMPPEEAVSVLEDAWAAPAFAGALAAFDQYRFSGFGPVAGVPVTVAWGDRDRLLLYGRQAPRARAELPWARHVTLGAGHTPFFDDPAAVAQVIRSGTR